jgi:8-oxo-dGTP pyrophosphatase MutT (NUDIX family)
MTTLSDRTASRQVVCLVFYHQGDILLEQRLDRDAFYGEWLLPGGKVEDADAAGGDVLQEAARRESQEETGLTPTRLRTLINFEQRLRDGRIFHFNGMHVQEWTGRLENREVGRRNLVWVPLEQAQRLMHDSKERVGCRIVEAFVAASEVAR